MKYINLDLLNEIYTNAKNNGYEIGVEKGCNHQYVIRYLIQHGNLSEKNIFATANIDDNVNTCWPCVTIIPEKGMTEDQYNELMKEYFTPVNPEEVNLADGNKNLHYILNTNESVSIYPEIHSEGSLELFVAAIGVQMNYIMEKLSIIQAKMNKKKSVKRARVIKVEDEYEESSEEEEV